MERRSVVEYLEDFLRRGRECAYVQLRGYRTERWTYRQVAETAFRFARELEKRGIGKGERVLLWGAELGGVGGGVFWLCLRGVIVVPVDDAGAADFAQRVLSASGWKAAGVLACSMSCLPSRSWFWKICRNSVDPLICAL